MPQNKNSKETKNVIELTEKDSWLLMTEKVSPPVNLLQSIIDEQIHAIEEKIQDVEDEHGNMANKLNTLETFLHHVAESDFSVQKFFQIYNTEDSLGKLLTALDVPQDEHNNWLLTLNAYQKSGTGYFFSNLHYYTSGWTGYVAGGTAIKVDKKLLTKKLISSVRTLAQNEGDLYVEAHTARLIKTLKKRNDERCLAQKDVLENSKTPLLKILTLSREFPEISIIAPPDNNSIKEPFRNALSKAGTNPDNATFESIKQSFADSITEFADAKQLLLYQQTQVKNWLSIIKQISPLIKTVTIPEVHQWYEQYINETFRAVVPVDLPKGIKLKTCEDKLNFLQNYHDSAIKEVDKAKESIEKTVKKWDKTNTEKTIEALRSHIQDTKGFWNKILMWLSPSYRKCIIELEKTLQDYDVSLKKRGVKKDGVHKQYLTKIHHRLEQAKVETCGWVGAKPVSEMYKVTSSSYPFFQPPVSEDKLSTPPATEPEKNKTHP